MALPPNPQVDVGPTFSRRVGRRVSFSGQVGILGPPSAPSAQPRHSVLGPGGLAAGGCGPGAGPSGAALGNPTWPPRLTSAQVEHEHAEITRVQAVVERLESKLGNTHAQVGTVGCAHSEISATPCVQHSWSKTGSRGLLFSTGPFQLLVCCCAGRQGLAVIVADVPAPGGGAAEQRRELRHQQGKVRGGAAPRAGGAPRCGGELRGDAAVRGGIRLSGRPQ
jgi:hypothetical protein